MTTTSQQIIDLRRQRRAALDRMERLNEATEHEPPRLFTDAEQKEWDQATAVVHSIDQQLPTLLATEREHAMNARPVENPLHPTLAMPGRSERRFPGQVFARLAMAMAQTRGNVPAAVEIAAARWQDTTPEVVEILRAAGRMGSTSDPLFLQRAAVAPGTTVDPVWAGPLVQYQNAASEFIELLRPVTILGRLPGLRSVPFNVRIPRQTAGSTAQWVGEGLSKPVSSLSFDTMVIPFTKVAVIVVITTELARFSNPSAEQLVRDDMVAAVAQAIDETFIGNSAPVAGVKPGGIGNGATTIPSSGSSVTQVTADLNAALLSVMTALQGRVTSPAWVMSGAAALFLASLRVDLGTFAFPSMSLGGTPGSLGPSPSLFGLPVVVSSNVTVDGGGLSTITLLEQSELMVADDGQVLLDASQEASLQMDNAPATPPTPLVSLWQMNLLGLRAERFIYWQLRRPGAVAQITGFPAASAVAAAADRKTR